MKVLIYSGTFLASITLAELSHADLKFCNSRSDGVWIAYASQVYSVSHYPCGVQEVNKPELFSWYYAPPNGGCVTLIHGNLTLNNGVSITGPAGPQFYWYAEGANGEYWAGSDAQYCPMNSEASYLDPEPSCNAQYVNFRYLYTGNYNDYTVNLY